MSQRARTVCQPYCDTSEPSFEELLADPIMHQLMQSDRVEPAFLRRLNDQVAQLRELLPSVELQ